MDVLLSDSDWETYSESASSEQEEIEFLYRGQAQSIFSSLEESIGKIDDFLSFERGFSYGDIVCSVTDPSGQLGKVVNINLFVDLESVHGKSIKEVNSMKLLKIRSISVGDYVVHGAWLGKVDKVVDCVSVVFDDGTKCEITAVDQEKIVPVSSNLLEDSQYCYYPGQRVRVKLSHVPKSARLCGNWRSNEDEGTVCSVEAGVVYVDWVASAQLGGEASLPPPSLQDSKNLTLLSCFSHASWQLGDWCIFPVASCKDHMEQIIRSSAHGLIGDHKTLERGFQKSYITSSLDEIFTIVKTKTKIDVVWQDGSCTLAVDSQKLVPIGAVNAHEFWPEQFVLEKDISATRRWGIVQAVDAKERTAKVQWKFRGESEVNGSNDQKVETVSVYELLEHPDFSFCYGDVVFKVFQNHLVDQADEDHEKTDTTATIVTAVNHKNCGQDQNECLDTRYLSCIGVVLGFKDGAVEVKWATGFETKVAPNEICRIDKNEGVGTISMNDEENVEELNHRMIEHDAGSSIQQGKELMNFNDPAENCNKYPLESSSFFLPRAAIGFFTSIVETLFGSNVSTSSSSLTSVGDNSEDQNESEILLKEEIETSEISEPDTCGPQMFRNTYLKQEGEQEEDQDSTFYKGAKNPDHFRQFDMVTNPSDHHYLGASKGLAQSQVKRDWLRRIQQEWSILERNLPETIYVRVYEERMDLLRAVLVGAPGTPYHDGLFFFDILLPPEYPHEPPLVHYNSGGLRVNPNLYESGRVCLSLLNTWTGTSSEVWNPGSSTILQVLLSLQALVLNDRPYFNEAGYDKQMGRAEGEKNSVSYNENAFILSCKSMLYLLCKPPNHFEALVKEHFSQRAEHILLACKAYMEGAVVGCAENRHEVPKGSSTGFKMMLAKIFPKLVEAFSELGIECNQSLEPNN